MSNKPKDFAEAAEQAEKEFLAAIEPETPPEEAANPEVQTLEPAEQPEAPAPSVVEEDKYKAAVKAMNEAQRKAAEAAKREEEFTKRQAELEAKLNEALESARKIAESAKAQPVDDDDDLEADMPEVSRIAEKKTRKALTPLEQRLAEIEKEMKAVKERNTKLEEDTRAKTMYSEIKVSHPDFEDVLASEEMQAWITNEAPPIYKAIFDGAVPYVAKDAIAVLNAFKQTQTPKKSQPAKQTPSDAEIAAPVKVAPQVSTQTKTKPLPTAKEMDWFMHNAHKLNAVELAEWEARLTQS